MSRVLAIAMVLLLGLAARADAATLRTGFMDGAVLSTPGTVWLTRAVDSGASIVRIPSGWAGIAPRTPSRPSDPADPAYTWAGLDTAVKAAAEAGLEPFVSLTGAPAWAEGDDRPDDVDPGAWRPEADAYEPFAQALARRYDGTYPDPAGGVLPRVRAFQPWNEANLSKYLAPQWRRVGVRWVTEAPGRYRALQNAFYRGIKASQPSATVVTTGTAPFGDYQPGANRIPPAQFVREALCLTRELKRVPRCGAMRFDALAHHPYSVGGPARKALNIDDVSVPDMAKLTQPARAAVRLGTALPRKAKRLWVTEASWDSSPPDPDGVPARRHAEWAQGLLAALQRQGVDTITWYLLVDQAPVPAYNATNQSGLYLRDGTPKLAQRAFRMPFVVDRRTTRSVRVWARAPKAGALVVEERRGSRWVVRARARLARGEVLDRRVRITARGPLRARMGSEVSRSSQ